MYATFQVFYPVTLRKAIEQNFSAPVPLLLGFCIVMPNRKTNNNLKDFEVSTLIS